MSHCGIQLLHRIESVRLPTRGYGERGGKMCLIKWKYKWDAGW